MSISMTPNGAPPTVFYRDLASASNCISGLLPVCRPLAQIRQILCALMNAEISCDS